jgi:hypothetical protein
MTNDEQRGYDAPSSKSGAAGGTHIDVVPRKRTNTWVWIILAIVAALVVFALINRRSA